ncbi:hypothetical protein OF829_10055 [Sphingomonas sp. LB-2]|uniref:hypothetical protein n=1 Tax=Sphingomonas caeni TaxID=2984949 RepID=UPI00222ED84C|nr:hypothetical protein [Sphingomonas caeni]MCW3847586.1 hypothetical protein [Sphingomonas caeni]
MRTTSRRTLIGAAAAAAATPAFAAAQGAASDEDSGNVQTFPNRNAAARARIAAGTSAVLCAGFARAGDRGQALYARVAAEPGHTAKFRSADGGWWELAENRLNPFMFGARAKSRVDDSGAIQAMFDYMEAKGDPYPVGFMGARYYLAKGVRLPSVPPFVALDIDGGGATLFSDQPITIFSRIPANQDAAMRAINGSHYDIHHFQFQGDGLDGQVGLHLGATYGNVVRNCLFARLAYGSIGSFCLGSAWRDNLYHLCHKRAAVVQTGTGYDSGPIWPGAVETNSASNVTVFENCRVFGHPRQVSAFGIFGSDAVRINGCISEGHGANIDVQFDYQGAGTVKQFHIDMFHCEAPNGKLNFKIRASGKVWIERIIRSYPAALLDMQGSVNCEVIVRGLAWLGELPAARADGPNPKGRWFYGAGGNGFGAATERWGSGGTSFRFEDCVEDAWKQIRDPERWEGGKLPEMVYVRGNQARNEGVLEWSNAPITFASPIGFGDGSRLAGVLAGTVTAKTALVPANASVDETFEVPGLNALLHSLALNPQYGGHAPPPGIVWNAYIERDGAMTLRLTNVTAKPIALTPGAIWSYAAPRRG